MTNLPSQSVKPDLDMETVSEVVGVGASDSNFLKGCMIDENVTARGECLLSGD